jgi:glycosyltransferase involved in cell wall biosynthesis
LADKIKLLIVAQHLEGGGAEKILFRLILNFYKEMEITLVTLYDRGRYLEEARSLDGVDYECIHAEKGNTINFVTRLRKIIRNKKPDRVLSFLYYQNILTYLALTGWNIPFILSERSNHRIYLTSSLKHRVWKWILQKAYRLARTIITVSEESKSAIISDFKSTPEKVHTIYNGLSFPLLDKLMKEPVTDFDFSEDVKYVIAVGSLSQAKNYPLLISGFSILHSHHENTELIIIGKGEQESRIKGLVVQKGLGGKVHFMGYCSNPYKYLKKATCYVLSSSWEGFPNSLLEAMYINGHVISTDCPTGPSEIITHYEDGLLCEPDNPEELAIAMGKMCFDEILRKKIYENSRIKIAKFDEEIMIGEYRELLLKLS